MGFEERILLYSKTISKIYNTMNLLICFIPEDNFDQFYIHCDIKFNVLRSSESLLIQLTNDCILFILLSQYIIKFRHDSGELNIYGHSEANGNKSVIASHKPACLITNIIHTCLVN